MVYDCFTFFNELDLLEIRLNVLDEVVDKFVLVEANHTHQGRVKGYHYEENKDRYAKWHDRIIHVKVTDMPTHDSWAAENHQRNCILRGLNEAKDDDVLLISDLDEIPTPESVYRNRNSDVQVGYLQQLYYYFLNVENFGFSNWTGTRLSPKKMLGQPQSLREFDPQKGEPIGGWHWSFIGGPEAIRTKIEAFAHGENNTEDYRDITNIRRRVSYLKDPFDRNQCYVRVDVDEKFPKYLRDNQDKYQHLILSE